MTKASRPTRTEGYKMFFDSATEEGPQVGQTITINGNSQCIIKQARLVSNKGHFFYRIVAQDETGTHFSTSMPTEFCNTLDGVGMTHLFLMISK